MLNINQNRFWAKVNKHGPVHPNLKTRCWLWTGTTSDGYGGFSHGLKAHRVSWRITKGPVPKGKWVLHHCDIRRCVNPAHLFLGNARDNVLDMYAKGRGVNPLGEKHGKSKLTEAAVRYIRNAHSAKRASMYQLAAKYKVTRIAIRSVIRRRTWAHVA